MKSLRIAFLTPEFVTKGENSGGIAAYIYRISRALHDMGHKPEIFTLSRQNSPPINFEGIRVERVKPYHSFFLQLLFKAVTKSRIGKLERTYKNICFAIGVRRALNRREKGQPYDFVHSSDFFTPGLFVGNTAKRPLLVRSSWARDLCLEADGLSDNFDEKCVSLLEKHLLRRSNVVYAPSNFVANHYSKRFGLNVRTLRPPFLLDATIASNLPWGLPKRFLFHFGTALGPVKGTDILAAALPLVWREEPGFTTVWAGRERRPGLFAEFARTWGVHADKVVLLGEIEKPKLYAVLTKAEASVLPSRYDNLPNTAIESLALGVPVIGPNGASFDELVEPGINGELFALEDPVALSEILLKVWRRQVGWIGKPYRTPTLFNQMEPHVAALNLIRLAGLSP